MEESECILRTGFGVNGAVIDLYYNHKPVIESPKSGCVNMLVGLVIIFAIIGFLKMIFS